MPTKTERTVEAIAAKTRQYAYPSDFMKSENSDYQWVLKQVRKNPALYKVFWGHVEGRKPCNIMHTEDKILKVARKYKYPKDFERKDNRVYQAARRCPELFAKATSHMSRKQILWNDRNLKEVTRGYSELGIFIKEQPNAYKHIQCNNKWQYVAHMDTSRQFYSDDDLLEIAKQYGCRKDFYTNDVTNYNKVMRRGLSATAFAHMEDVTWDRTGVGIYYLWNLPNTDIWKSGICNPTGLEIRFNEVALQYKQTPSECFAVRIGDAQDFEKNFINRTFQDLRVPYAELSTHLDLNYMAHRIEHLNQKGVKLTQGKLIDGYTEMFRFTPEHIDWIKVQMKCDEKSTHWLHLKDQHLTETKITDSFLEGVGESDEYDWDRYGYAYLMN